MVFWKDNQGNDVSLKEFFSRWKEGINNISPYQRIKSQILGYQITMLGIVCGIVVSFFSLSNAWWVIIILVGALIINLMQYFSSKKQLGVFKNPVINFVPDDELIIPE